MDEQKQVWGVLYADNGVIVQKVVAKDASSITDATGKYRAIVADVEDLVLTENHKVVNGRVAYVNPRVVKED